MKISYKKLLLTTAFILTSINVDAFADPDSDVSEETPTTLARRLLPPSQSGVLGAVNKDQFDKEIDVSLAQPNPLALPSNAEEAPTKEMQLPLGSHLSAAKFPPIGTEIPRENLFLPSALGNLKVSYSNKEFYVSDNKRTLQVQRPDLSKELRGISEKDLKGFLSAGYLSVKKMDDDYAIDARFRLRGGGPLTGVLAGLGTVVGMVGCAVTGNAPGVIALAYAAPAIITAGMVAPTP